MRNLTTHSILTSTLVLSLIFYITAPSLRAQEQAPPRQVIVQQAPQGQVLQQQAPPRQVIVQQAPQGQVLQQQAPPRQVIVQPAPQGQVLQQAPPRQVIVQPAPQGQVLQQAPPRQVIVQPAPQGQVLQQAPPRQVIVQQAPQGQVLQQAPPRQVIVQPAPQGQVLQQAPPRQVIVQPAPQGQVLQQAPPRQVIVQPAPQGQVLQQAPPRQVIVQQAPQGQVLQQAPPRQVIVQPAPQGQVLQQAPPRQVIVQQAPQGQVLQQAPPRQVATKKSGATNTKKKKSKGFMSVGLGSISLSSRQNIRRGSSVREEDVFVSAFSYSVGFGRIYSLPKNGSYKWDLTVASSDFEGTELSSVELALSYQAKYWFIGLGAGYTRWANIDFTREDATTGEDIHIRSKDIHKFSPLLKMGFTLPVNDSLNLDFHIVAPFEDSSEATGASADNRNTDLNSEEMEYGIESHARVGIGVNFKL